VSEDAEQQEIIIVRRHGAHEDGHHGGAWKIAYADFVTAMMAFFLVLWILNSTNKDSQTIIARYFNPVKMEDFAKNKRGIRDEKPTDDKPPVNEGEPDKAPPQGQTQGKMEQKGKEPLKDINAKALMNEETLFQNPYAALEQIAGKAPVEKKNGKVGSAAETGSADAYRDPFRAAEGAADDADEAAEDETPPAPPAGAQAEAAAKSEAAAKAEAARPGQKSAQTPAQAAAQEAAAKAAAEAAQEAADKADAEALQKQLAAAARDEIGVNQPQLQVKATREGLLISLTDNDKFGMFELGSSQPNPKMVYLMERIARMLKNRPGGVVLRGFTDSRPFRDGAADNNWRLSASRAQMAQFMLMRGGLDAARLERIEAYADRKPINAAKPESAENRRIEILLRKASS